MPDSRLSLVRADAPEQRIDRVTLVERKTALDALAEFTAQARSGEGRLVLLEGEAGVGKSALLEHFTLDLPGSRVLLGACDGMFTPRPLGPLFDIAQQVRGRLHSLCRADAAREELFEAFLTELCAPGPLPVVVIEDVHWADEATLDLLGFLARRIREIPVLLIVSYRDDELADTHPLRVALGHLAVQRCARRLPLAPLSAQAVRMLAAGRGVDPEELYRVTGGNPFYVREVLEAGLGEVPRSARDVVLARAGRLGPKARETLEAAALIGGTIDEQLLGHIVTGPALAEVIASGLVAGHPVVRFRHEIARQAIEQAVRPARRSEIHARILRGLRTLGCDDDARLAYHAEEAMIAARRGEGDVWPHLDAAMTAADGSTGPMYIGAVRLARAEARWLESDLNGARQEAELAGDASAGITDPWLNGEIAVWLLRTGSPRAGQRELAEPYRLQLTGNHRDAAELFDALGCPYDAALALLGAPDELALRRALDICTSLGAVATARIIRQKMRSLGRGCRSPAGSHRCAPGPFG